MGPRLMLKELGAVKVTLPDGETVEAEGVAEYLEALPGRSDWPDLD
jgi:hypothetical protein